jgi:L,D-transpeptidase ErfK/SrfK
MPMNKITLSLLLTILFYPYPACGQHPLDTSGQLAIFKKDTVKFLDTIKTTFEWVTISDTIKIEDYFEFMDSLVGSCDSINHPKINEHHIVHCNPWIIDTLSQTDYYVKKAKDSFVYDQKKMLVLRPGDSLRIPKKLEIDSLNKVFSDLRLDVNIPEFKLRIYIKDSLLFEFPVRVGQNRSKYLAMSNRITNLRTQKGRGHIVAHHKNPTYYNPVNMHRYLKTKRDDGKLTRLPQIPWLETEINGLRNGQMIHPTTNPETLGKAYSNGCIGTGESDAWVLYYYAPIGTIIDIRYDLIITDKNNKNVSLKDIYSFDH